MEPILEMRGVSFGYAAAPVLQDVSLHLHAGQFAALVGPSGAGKTSLLKLVLGSLRPAHGDITVNGQHVDGSPAGGVAYVPQVETVDLELPRHGGAGRADGPRAQVGYLALALA